MSESRDESKRLSRRDIMGHGLRIAGIGALGGAAGYSVVRAAMGNDREEVWQIDPDKCIQCGRCATDCVLEPSAVKCIHSYSMCGYCELCFGYFVEQPTELSTAAENQRCPVGALKRTWVEDPYYEYVVEEDLCIGCGLCIKGCEQYGNGSLYLQVMHHLCRNCNQCTIATACPADAFVRVPADRPYLLKASGEKSE